MLNISYQKNNLFKFVTFINFCTTFLYYDDHLVLKDPKLLKLIEQNITDSIASQSLDVVLNNDLPNLINDSNSFDDQQKNSSLTQPFSKGKKNKTKSAKNKFRSTAHLEDDNLFRNNPKDIFNPDLLNRSINKSRKFNLKTKKQYKNKLTISENKDIQQQSIENHLNDSLDLDNSIKNIYIKKNLTIQELSNQIFIPEAEIITYLFLNKGISATINQILNIDIIRDIAQYYKINIIESTNNQDIIDYLPRQVENSSNSVRRSPIVTILGHVDHGKTTLLDAILKTNLTNQESGGITQAISGYEVLWNYLSKDVLLIFLDTPGHQSFKEMRLRGAKVTDLVLLVIAVDDGVKPQTIEAISYIVEMQLSCIVVLTKCDKSVNNTEKIKQDLATNGLLCEEWGGNIKIIEISAIKNHNIDLLLSHICSFAETNNLLADPQNNASGVILESYLDKKQGVIANILVQNGTLHVGDIIAVKHCYGKVKNIININNLKVKSSGPSSIIQVLAFNVVPEAGSLFVVFKSEKNAKEYSSKYLTTNRIDNSLNLLDTRITLNSLSDPKQLKIILKTNTQGMLEAILNLLSTISQSKVQINIIDANCGNISNKDIELALTTDSIILGFDVNILPQINNLLKKSQINFKVFNIIYDLFDYVEGLMLSLVDTEYDKVLIGDATVQTVFNMNQGYVAGCFVNQGKLKIKSYIDIYRNQSIVYSGYVNSLKRIKNDVHEVISPNECGLMTDFDDWQTNDVIKAYDLVAKKKTL